MKHLKFEKRIFGGRVLIRCILEMSYIWIVLNKSLETLGSRDKAAFLSPTNEQILGKFVEKYLTLKCI